MSKQIRGVILDIDGTLINSNDAHARAWVDALHEVDIQVTFADVRPLIGMGGDKLLPAIANIEESSPLGQQIGKRRAELFKAHYLPRVSSFAKTRELLLTMRGRGISLAVASSASQAELAPLLAVANIGDLIEGATSSSDAERSKPDPDIVRAALARLELAPARVIMLGDTPYDIEAAKRSALGTVALRCGGRGDYELAGALAIYDDPADLLRQFASSPFAS